MQPLISVDHESRQNSYRATEDFDERASEDTPLLARFPQNIPRPRNSSTTLIVSLLLLILSSGVVIGIYLLVLQNNAENVLPPVEIPLQLVSRSQWDNGSVSPTLSTDAFKARKVIIVQSDSRECMTTDSCVKLLKEIQVRSKRENLYLPYNFLVSPNGQTYEGLGWHRMSPLYPEHAMNSLVLAFIGNYTEIPPTREQIDEAKNFIAESVSHDCLEPDYILFGKRTKDLPRYLFRSLMHIPQWNNSLTDK